MFSYLPASKPATQSRKYWGNIGKCFVFADDTLTYRVMDVCTYGGRKGRYYYKCSIALDSRSGADEDEGDSEWIFKSCSLLDNKNTATWLE